MRKRNAGSAHYSDGITAHTFYKKVCSLTKFLPFPSCFEVHCTPPPDVFGPTAAWYSPIQNKINNKLINQSYKAGDFSVNRESADFTVLKYRSGTYCLSIFTTFLK
jgi:hypothetical protein